MPDIRSLLWVVLGGIRRFAISVVPPAVLKIFKITVQAEKLREVDADALSTIQAESLMIVETKSV